MLVLAVLKNYEPFRTPKSFSIMALLKKFEKQLGLTSRDYGKVSGDRTIEDIEKRRQDPWNLLFVAGQGPGDQWARRGGEGSRW